MYSKIKDFLVQQNGAYAIMTALMLPATLLFMGLAIGALTLLNDKSRLADASEAAALTLAHEDATTNTAANNNYAQQVYQYYFPYDLKEISNNTIKTAFQQIDDPTVPHPDEITPLSCCVKYDQTGKCIQQAYHHTHHYINLYRSSGYGTQFHSFASGLIGNLGFHVLETVNNTAVGAVRSTVEYDDMCAIKPEPPKPPLNKHEITAVIVYDDSPSMASQASGGPAELADSIRRVSLQIVDKLHTSLGGNDKVYLQFLATANIFIDNNGVKYDSSNFAIPTLDLLKKGSSGDYNFLNANYMLPYMDVFDYLNFQGTDLVNVFSNQSELIKQINNRFRAENYYQTLTGLAAPIIYANNELYYKGSTQGKHKTVNNLFFMITDGTPHSHNNHDPKGSKAPSVILGENDYCGKLNKAMQSHHRNYFSYFIMIDSGDPDKGVIFNGSCFSKTHFQNLSAEGNYKKLANNEKLSTTISNDILNYIPPNTRKQAPDFNSSSKLTQVSYDQRPRLIYRFNQNTPPLPQ